MKARIPFVRWPGGLFHIATRVARVLPAHRVYVEPFAGGLSVLWNKKPAKVEVVGDTQPALVRFYDAACRGALDGCRPVVQDKTTFQKLKNCQDKDACCFIQHNRMAYDGAMGESRSVTNDGKAVAAGILSRRREYVARLRRIHLRIADFEDTMRRFDGPDTLHFLDPPWTKDAKSAAYAQKMYGRGHSDLTLERVVQVAKDMIGQVAIAYFDSPEARTILKGAGFHVYRIRVSTGGNVVGKKKRDRLLATTFDVSRAARRKPA